MVLKHYKQFLAFMYYFTMHWKWKILSAITNLSTVWVLDGVLEVNFFRGISQWSCEVSQYQNMFWFCSKMPIGLALCLYRPWSFKPVTDITGWYFFPVILFWSFPDKSIYSASINWSIGNALMKPITDCKRQEQDYREKTSKGFEQ